NTKTGRVHGELEDRAPLRAAHLSAHVHSGATWQMTQQDLASTQALAGSTTTQPTARAWFVLAMLCFVYVLNFLDRQLLSILAKPIQDTLHVTDGQLGLIGGLYFAFFYCFIAIPVGWIADRTHRVGVLALACGIWSAATMACGMAANYTQLVIARMTVGF